MEHLKVPLLHAPFAPPPAGDVALLQTVSDFIASPGQGAIALDMANVGAGNFLVAFLQGVQNHPSVNGQTSNGTVLLHVAGAENFNGNGFTTIWCGVIAAGGAMTVTFTFGGGLGYPSATLTEWRGLASELGVANGGQFSDTNSVALSTTGPAALGAMVGSLNQPGQVSADSMGPEQISLSAFNISYSITAAAGPAAHSYGFPGVNNNVSVSIAAFG